MKARIRKTGEIVDIINYNRCCGTRSHQDYVSYIDSKGEEHDRESLNYYWDFEPIETIAEVLDNKHWQDVRERAAIAAMQGMMANPELLESTGFSGTYYKWHIERKAVEYADALVEQLKKK